MTEVDRQVAKRRDSLRIQHQGVVSPKCDRAAVDRLYLRFVLYRADRFYDCARIMLGITNLLREDFADIMR